MCSLPAVSIANQSCSAVMIVASQRSNIACKQFCHMEMLYISCSARRLSWIKCHVHTTEHTSQSAGTNLLPRTTATCGLGLKAGQGSSALLLPRLGILLPYRLVCIVFLLPDRDDRFQFINDPVTSLWHTETHIADSIDAVGKNVACIHVPAASSANQEITSKAALLCAEEAAITMLASPILTRPNLWTMAMPNSSHLCSASWHTSCTVQYQAELSRQQCTPAGQKHPERSVCTSSFFCAMGMYASYSNFSTV